MRSPCSSNSSTSPRVCRNQWWILGVALVAAIWYIPSAIAEGGGGREGVGRKLLDFWETQGNASFQCSPSGPCVLCRYSEKNDEIYRCSETGYHTPSKCVEIQVGEKEGSNKKFQRRLLSFKNEDKINDQKTEKVMPNTLLSPIRHLKWRKLLDTSSKSDSSKQSYVTYRSCLPVEPDEKLSFLGFEVIMMCLLLISGPIAYFRQKHSTAMAGVAPIRIPANLTRL